MLDLQHRPRLQGVLHWLLAACGLLLEARTDLPSALTFLPEGSTWPKYLGYVLTLAAFSRILGRRAGLVKEPRDGAELDTAAPSNVIPFSEAETVTEKPDPKKSA